MYTRASIFPVVCLWGQGMPQYSLWVVSGVRGTPQYLHEFFEGSRDTNTPTELFPGSVGGPYTSVSFSWGQGAPPYSHGFSFGALAALIPPWVVPGSRDTPLLPLSCFSNAWAAPIPP